MSVPTLSTRDRIIDAAIELFAEQGYPNTSMKNIAAAVDIKSPSIYSHFNSKEDILDTILDEYISHTTSMTASAGDIAAHIDDASPEELIEKLFFTFSAGDAPRYTKILKVITHEQFREPKATAFIRDYLLGECQQMIRNVLDMLVDAKKIRPVETGIYAKLFISLTLASSTEMMFYGFKEYQKREKISNRAARQFLINQIVHGVQ